MRDQHLGDIMRPWRLHVQLADLFRRAEEDEYEEHVTEIVQEIEHRLKKSGWLELRGNEFDDDRQQLELLFEELGESMTYDEFNVAWQYLYDEADEDRVWIEIIKVATP